MLSNLELWEVRELKNLSCFEDSTRALVSETSCKWSEECSKQAW